MDCLYAYDREGFGDKLYDAAIVGHTTSNSTRLWVRVRKKGLYSLVLFKSFKRFNPNDIGSREIKEYLDDTDINYELILEKKFSYDTDLTNVFMIDALDASTQYYYAVVAKPEVGLARRWRFGFEKPHYFLTQKTISNDITFGVSSCHDPFKKKNRLNAGLWDEYYAALQEKKADFVIAGGDQAYVDSTEDDVWQWLSENKACLYENYHNDQDGLVSFCLSIYRRVYRKYWSSEGLRKVFGRFPTYMIWDDHEIMDGWGSYTKQERRDKISVDLNWEDDWGDAVDIDWDAESDDFKDRLIDAMFVAAKQVYIEYQHSHNPDNKLMPQDDGFQFDYPFSQGEYGFYVLDMRGHHDLMLKNGKPLNEGQTILGLSAFKRFKSWMKNNANNYSAIFIVSTVPMVHWHSTFINMLDIGEAKDDFRDEWDHEFNYKERDKILDLVFKYSEKSGKSVIFISGDVHCSAIFQLSRPAQKKAKVFQFTSSGITRPPAPGISEVMTLEKGKLGHKPHAKDGKITRFKKLCFIAKHNFGLIECIGNSNGKAEIWGSIYSGDVDDEQGISRRRIKFS